MRRIAWRCRSVMLPFCMPSAIASPTRVVEASFICCTDPQVLWGLSGLVGDELSDSGSRLDEMSSRIDWRHAAIAAAGFPGFVEATGGDRALSKPRRLVVDGDSMV